MQKVTLMFLPLNWNAGSVSVVTVFRTQETATFPLTWGKVISLPFTFFSFFPPALYLLTAAQSDPNTQYQEKWQSLGPWDFIPSGLTAVMGGTPQSFQGIDPFPQLPNKLADPCHGGHFCLIPESLFSQFLRTLHGHPFPSPHYALE